MAQHAPDVSRRSAAAEAFTFSTATWGGRGAVTDLGDRIVRMRTVHPDAVPIVELRAAEMPTRYGRKSKPAVQDRGLGKADANKRRRPSDVLRRGQSRAAARPRGDMDDEIPF